MSFQDRLRAEIDYQGLMIKEVAAKAGISKRTLDSYVDSRAVIPKADIAVSLARALNVSVEYLITGEESDKKKNESDIFYYKYKRFEKVLTELDKLSMVGYNKSELGIVTYIQVCQKNDVDIKGKMQQEIG
jgi:transcriptional regulator with XRE-family HTH domain